MGALRAQSVEQDREVALPTTPIRMREVAELAASGVLPATIGRRYTLDEGPRACVDFVREHTTGKLVVTV